MEILKILLQNINSLVSRLIVDTTNVIKK